MFDLGKVFLKLKLEHLLPCCIKLSLPLIIKDLLPVFSWVCDYVRHNKWLRLWRKSELDWVRPWVDDERIWTLFWKIKDRFEGGSVLEALELEVLLEVLRHQYINKLLI